MSSHNFEADTGKILDIVIHSLYSNKEIFLRELVSNASDAIDKLRYLSVSDKKLSDLTDAFAVTITADKRAKTLTISDNGIGMDEDEVIASLGTIARSGTKSFLEALGSQKDKKAKSKDSDNAADVSLIGQFGVGFYSAFMVADKVEVLTRKAGTNKAYLWSSDGRTGYDIEAAEKAEHGTMITLHMKKDATEFLEQVRVGHVIKTYADHISYPVNFLDGDDSTQLNSGSALWTRPKSDITDEDYESFFADMGAAYGKPLVTLHNVSEGTVSFTNLLCIPQMRPYDLFDPARKPKVKLYINRVYITDDCDALIPAWLRFVRGIVDTADIDLNVSRELLQHNKTLDRIGKAVVRRILSELKKMHDKKPEDYDALWSQFGVVLKEGMYEDADNREKLLAISRFHSSEMDGLTGLSDYVSRMKEGQDEIYYLSADTITSAEMSPHLEGFKARGIEVLYFTDPVDEFWLPLVPEFEGKSFASITKGGVDIDKFEASDDAKTDDEAPDVDKLIAAMKEALGSSVADIRISKTLTDSPACLVADEGGMDIQMQRLMKAHDPNFQDQPRILEVNPKHALVQGLNKLVTTGTDGELVNDAAFMMFEQSLILEGKPPQDVAAFSQRMTRLMTRGLKL